MAKKTRAQLVTLLDANIVTGGRRTTAAALREQQNAIIESLLNILDDKDQINGYAGLDSGGLINPAQLPTVTVLESLVIPCSDELTPLVTGTARVTFRIPYAFTLLRVKASLTTACVGGGSPFTVDVKRNGNSIFTTKVTIDPSRTTSLTSSVQNVLNVSQSVFTNDDVITVDINSINGGGATGLKVTLIGHQ